MQTLNKNLLQQNIENSIKNDIKYSNIAGAAVMVAQNGKILMNEHFGFSDAPNQKPLKSGAMFRLASMTKPVTAIATLIGAEKGWFSLDDKVSDHFPEFENIYVGKLENGKVVPSHKPKRPVVLSQLLSHNSGFMASSELYLPQEFEMPKEMFETNKTAAQYCLENTCLCFEPYYQTGYSGYFAFDLIALLIERHSGMKYADFLNEYIFKPLEIKDITYTPTPEQWERVVSMSDRGAGGILFNVDMTGHTFEGFPLTYTCAGAGLVGSIEDYFKFAEMLRQNGTYNGKQIVSPELFPALYKKYVPQEYMPKGAKHSWGLGVRVTVGDDCLPDGCYGWSGAYGTHFFIDPKNQITAIYMKNNRWHDSHGGGMTAVQFEKDIMNSFE
ncbi:MAG: beta-lactamase family protein [Ruminococcaceae bacterium]|nr:beta-lactamase family protein [Oscillospiraceae bacterium]